MAKMQKSMVTDREEIYTEDNYVWSCPHFRKIAANHSA